MHGQGTIQIKLPSISTSEEAFECSAEVALFECRMGIRSTAKELFLTAGSQNLTSMSLLANVEFASPKFHEITFGVICTGKEIPAKNPNAAAENDIRIQLSFILSQITTKIKQWRC
jgi:hypothetical protein